MRELQIVGERKGETAASIYELGTIGVGEVGSGRMRDVVMHIIGYLWDLLFYKPVKGR
ncbi:hypothetical protein D3C86_2089030 [compost metagenome]